MRTYRHHVDCSESSVHVQRYLAESLNGVSVKEYVRSVIAIEFIFDPADLFYWHYRPCLVVDRHDGNQYDVFTQSVFQLFQIEAAFVVHPDIFHFKSHGLEPGCRFQHGGMLDGGGYYLVSATLSAEARSLQRCIVRLRSAGSEVNLIHACSYGFGKGFSGFLQKFFRLYACRMQG